MKVYKFLLVGMVHQVVTVSADTKEDAYGIADNWPADKLKWRDWEVIDINEGDDEEEECDDDVRSE